MLIKGMFLFTDSLTIKNHYLLKENMKPKLSFPTKELKTG